MNNKKTGNDFEANLCDYISLCGFWCYNLAVKSEGQPADVIAVRNEKAYLIDCKVCDTAKGFALSRIEENQHLAMSLWNECGNGEGWFAVRVANTVCMISYTTLKSYAEKQAYLTPKDILDCGLFLWEWVKECE